MCPRCPPRTLRFLVRPPCPVDSADASVVMMNTTLRTILFDVDHLRIKFFRYAGRFNSLKDSNVVCKDKILLGSSSHLKI